MPESRPIETQAAPVEQRLEYYYQRVMADLRAIATETHYGTVVSVIETIIKSITTSDPEGAFNTRLKKLEERIDRPAVKTSTNFDYAAEHAERKQQLEALIRCLGLAQVGMEAVAIRDGQRRNTVTEDTVSINEDQRIEVMGAVVRTVHHILRSLQQDPRITSTSDPGRDHGQRLLIEVMNSMPAQLLIDVLQFDPHGIRTTGEPINNFKTLDRPTRAVEILDLLVQRGETADAERIEHLLNPSGTLMRTIAWTVINENRRKTNGQILSLPILSPRVRTAVGDSLRLHRPNDWIETVLQRAVEGTTVARNFCEFMGLSKDVDRKQAELEAAILAREEDPDPTKLTVKEIGMINVMLEELQQLRNSRRFTGSAAEELDEVVNKLTFFRAISSTPKARILSRQGRLGSTGE